MWQHKNNPVEFVQLMFYNYDQITKWYLFSTEYTDGEKVAADSDLSVVQI